jgi:hypothetical protein
LPPYLISQMPLNGQFSYRRLSWGDNACAAFTHRSGGEARDQACSRNKQINAEQTQ